MHVSLPNNKWKQLVLCLQIDTDLSTCFKSEKFCFGDEF